MGNGAGGVREYLETLEKNGQLLRITEEVDTLDQMGAFVARSDYEHLDKALLFENPKGFDIPVLANTIGSNDTRMSEIFGVPSSIGLPGVAKKLGGVLQGGGIEPNMVDTKNAPVKEIIMTGDDIDLSKIPALRTNPRDGQGGKNFEEGRFISGVAVSKPKDAGRNVSYHRFELQSPTHGTVWVFRMTGDASSMETYWGAKATDPPDTFDPEKGEAFPMAFVLGVSPEIMLTGANPGIPHQVDDFNVIGGMVDHAIDLVKCETIDVDVPANAEIVIEGVLEPFDFGQQGAYASFNGYYDEARTRPVFKCTAITMRKDAMFQHVHIGLPLNECNAMASYFRGVRMFRDVQMVMPNLLDVFIDPAAGVGFTAHLKIKKGRVGEPKMAMLRAYTSLMGFCKHVFVYDEDIDIRNSHERDWALAHRFMGDRDILVIPNVIGMPIDPLAQGQMGGRSKLGAYDGYNEIPLNVRAFTGFDCTTPLGLEVMDRVVREPEVEAGLDELWSKVFDDLPLFAAGPKSCAAAEPEISALEQEMDAILPDELSPKEALELIYKLKMATDR